MAVFRAAHEYLNAHTDFYWKSFPSEIAPDAVIHERAYVASRDVKFQTP